MASGDGTGHPTTADRFGPLGDGSASRRPVIGGFHQPYGLFGTVYPRGYAWPDRPHETLPSPAGFCVYGIRRQRWYLTMADRFRVRRRFRVAPSCYRRVHSRHVYSTSWMASFPHHQPCRAGETRVVTHRLSGHMKPRPRRRGVLCLWPRRGRWSSNHDGSLSGHSAMVSCCADPPSAGFTRPTFSSATCNPRGYASSDTNKTLPSPVRFCV